MKSKIKLGLAAFIGSAILGLPGVANATLIGDEVTIQSASSTITTIKSTDVVTVGPGLEIACPDVLFAACESGEPRLFDGESFDIGASSITINLVALGFFIPGFQGWIFSDLDWSDGPGRITGFLLSTNIPTFGVGNVSFGDDSVAFNFAGIDGEDATYFVTVDLTVIHDVPEPASLALFGFGLLGFGLARRRRKTA